MRRSFVLVFELCLAVTAAADDWPRFRGPNGSGISDATTVPVEWTDADFRWSAAVPGNGNSSPVVAAGHVYVTSAQEDDKQRSLSCFRAADGELLWKKGFPFEPYKKHKNNSFASSTPAADEKHVYVWWPSREGSPLIAFTHAGEKIWEFDSGPWMQGQGAASSLIAFGESVFLCDDQDTDGGLHAIDRNTGQPRWTIPRNGKRACFTTPCVYSPDGRPPEIVFTHCFEGIVGVDAASGQQNWHIDVFGTFSQRAIGSPVVYGDLVIGSSGAVGNRRNVVAVRPLNTPSPTRNVSEVYRVIKSTPHVPSPLVYEDKLFLWEDRGVVSCYAAASGETVWQKRVGGSFFSSPVCIDGKLYNVDVLGNVVVLAASEEYEVLAKNKVPEGTRATPAVGDGILFIRTFSHLYAIGGQ